MDQNEADKIATEFTNISQIPCVAQYMKAGTNHNPTRLAKNEMGVYVLLYESFCFKVGKADNNSQARWNSHHYSLDKSTPSTFTKSFLSDIDTFKTYFENETIKKSIENFNTIISEYISQTNKFKDYISKLDKVKVKNLKDKLKLKIGLKTIYPELILK